MLRPVIAMAIVLRTIDAFGTFDQVFVLTRGGPGEATRLLSIFGYDTAFKFQQTGYAAALFVTMGLIILAMALAAVRMLRADGGQMRGAHPPRCRGGVVHVVVLLPIYWMVAASLKSNKEITQDATLYPHAPSFDNYRPAVRRRSSALSHQLDRGDACLGALALVFGSLAAYAIARFQLRSGSSARRAVAADAPHRAAGGDPDPGLSVDAAAQPARHLAGLIITYTALNITYCVWMMESFFREIPCDLEEAAMVDGDRRFTAFRRIVLPVAAPGLPRLRYSR